MNLQQILNCTPCLTALLLVALTGPLPLAAKPRPVRMFVPPETKPAAPTFALEDDPAVDAHATERDTTHKVPEKIAHTSQTLEVDMRISRATHHLQRGTELLNKGESEPARVEFDRALQYLITAPAGLPERARLERAYQKLVEDIFRLEVDAAAQPGSEQQPVFERAPIDDIAGMTFPIEPGLKGKVREQLNNVQSQLPLDMADPVLSFINFFSSPRGKGIFEAGLRRSGRYAPMIRRILDEEGLPRELIFLAQAESAFLPRAVSVKSATGMWQFMQWRGQEYGLKQTVNSDDRLDPERATRAAARHLRDLYTEFGDWYLAIAAYNCGPVAVARAIQRTGYADFWELYKRNVLPRETANYLPIIVAMTIMSKNLKSYGIENVQYDAPLEYDTVRVTAATHLALVADLARRPLQDIRDLNPAVLKLVAPDGYDVHVPKGSGRAVLAALVTVPAERRASWRVHHVTSNETMASIARQYHVPEKSIADVNGQQAFDPQAGDFLIIPVSYPGAEFATASLARRSTAPARSLSAKGRPTTNRTTTASNTGKRSVQQGSSRQTTAKKTTPAPTTRKPAPRTVVKSNSRPTQRASVAAPGAKTVPASYARLNLRPASHQQ